MLAGVPPFDGEDSYAVGYKHVHEMPTPLDVTAPAVSPMLSQIRVPTRVVHGADDLLVPPAAAPDLVAKIAGATLDLVPGMGHDLPLALLPRLADNIVLAARPH